MKWLESRIVWGSVLIVLGVVFLLQNLLNIELSNYLWAALMGLGGLLFFSVFFQGRDNWWALIPGFTLFSLAAIVVLPESVSDVWGGAVFLGGVGLSFLVIYLVHREQWWAIIPAGVLFTLAATSVLGETEESWSGGAFFLGLGLTFAIVALAPTQEGRMTWAWIPAGILTLIGLLVLTAIADMQLIGLIWPVALILVGGYVLVRTFLPRGGSGAKDE